MANAGGYKTYKSQFCRFCWLSASTFPENPDCADSEEMQHIVKAQAAPLMDGAPESRGKLRQMFL